MLIRIREIDFPDEIISAQREGRLVVFAGAGVSMGPPANYPDFAGLVKKIAKGTQYKRSKHEPIDHFLGRMHTNGVQVHRLTSELLTDPKSKPNPLHGAIIRLFANAHDLRLVTTNFDKHFFVEAARIYEEVPEIYNAPALPVGSNFSGLVYIHGSVEGPCERLVLTDSDFGRAYLTEGWARRMLLDIYANYVVIFIGYSHNDLVLNYLVRGLPRNSSKLYAMAPSDKTEHWDFLGVDAVGYPLRKTSDKHGALRESIEAWADLACMGSLEHEGRIKTILGSAPPIVGSEDDDYMQGVVEDQERVHFFVRNAYGVEWLLWAENRGLLEVLFTRRTEADPRIWNLSSWFASKYVLPYPEESLGVYERQGQVLSYPLWHDIVRHIYAADQLDSTAIRKWLPVLLDQHTSEDRVDVLEYLFNKAAGSGMMPLVVQLFEYLSCPHVKLEKSISFLEEGRRDRKPTSGKMCILGSYHWLKDALDQVLTPNMSSLAEELARVTSQSIRRAHEINVAYENADSEWDGTSFRRSAIEPNSQDKLTEGFDVVIDTCRDSIEWMLLHKLRAARRSIAEWAASPSPLLRRLAIHGMNKDGRRSPDQKIKWVVNNGLLTSILVHHEVFQLIRNAYPLSGTESRRAFLDHARTVTNDKAKENPDQDPAIYWRSLLTLLAWLNKATGGKCPIARGRMNRLKKKYPTFQMSEYPDFTHWTGGVTWGSESPVTDKELFAMSAREALRLLVSFKDERFDGPNRDGLLRVLSAAITKNPDWGLSIAGELIKRRRPNSDIWSRIFGGWAEAALDERQWRAILNIIAKNKRLMKHGHEVARLLERGLSKETDNLPYPLLEQAERIGSDLWSAVVNDSSNRDVGSGGWIQTAINETGGVLAEFFTMALSLRRREAGTRWKGIPSKLRKQLQRMAREESFSGEMAQVIFAGQLHFLFSCDPVWAGKYIVPLLSWERGSRRAGQAWHGFLGWGKWSDGLLPKLLPLYERSFSHLGTDLKEVREPFVGHIASICFFSSNSRARGKWLDTFLQKVDLGDRTQFAKAIKTILWDLPEERVNEAWNKWLKPYWDKRLLGKPVPLTEEEGSKMAEWGPHLAPVFAEFVELVVAIPQSVSVDSFVFHMLSEESLATKYPVLVSEYLLNVLPNSYETHQDFGELGELLDQLVQHEATHMTLHKVMDILAGRGSSLPAKFVDRLGGAGRG